MKKNIKKSLPITISIVVNVLLSFLFLTSLNLQDVSWIKKVSTVVIVSMPVGTIAYYIIRSFFSKFLLSIGLDGTVSLTVAVITLIGLIALSVGGTALFFSAICILFVFMGGFITFFIDQMIEKI